MINTLFLFLESFENILWGYIAFPFIMLLGIYLSFQSRYVQLRKFPEVIKIFFSFFKKQEYKKGEVHPLKAFFACIGGCVGVGNIVGICTAVQIGGPGALFWIWVTAFFGVTVKYAEVFLGLKYRIVNPSGGFNGGPMYFLQKIFKTSVIPYFVAFLLCIYGIEIYQFSIITKTVSLNFGFNHFAVVCILLILILFAASGGVQRVGNIASTVLPLFIIIYVGMSSWILIKNIHLIPQLISTIFDGAFSGHAAIGGFVGSTLLMTISQGVRRGCYTGDLGIGYASVIHSESSEKIPQKQALLVIFEIFIDNFMVCTSSILVILVTDVWHQPIETALLVQTALSYYFPYMSYFMPFFLLILGYNTINAYFCVGLKCAEFLSANYGRKLYYGYAVIALVLFSFVDSLQAQTVMSLAGGLLLIFNCYGIFRLRKELSYNFKESNLDLDPEVDETYLTAELA